MVQKEVNLDPIRGCLFGGAVGDALGYAVEFIEDYAIFERYGAEGITEYTLDKVTGKALISDDTQMTLFTANGLLVGDTRGCMRGIQGWPRGYVAMAYQDWLYTQTGSYENREERGYNQRSWLCDVPELYARRAPGNTCLSALSLMRIFVKLINGSQIFAAILREHHLADLIVKPQGNIPACIACQARQCVIDHRTAAGTGCIIMRSAFLHAARMDRNGNILQNMQDILLLRMSARRRREPDRSSSGR